MQDEVFRTQIFNNAYLYFQKARPMMLLNYATDVPKTTPTDNLMVN